MRTHQAERRATGVSTPGEAACAFAGVLTGEVAELVGGSACELAFESACEVECVEPCNLEPRQYPQPSG